MQQHGVIKSEPVALIAALAVIIVSGLAKAGIVLETGLVETLLVDGIIAVGAIIQRRQVTPNVKVLKITSATPLNR